jgi:flagellar operon protein
MVNEGKINNLLIPSVSKLPEHKKVDPSTLDEHGRPIDKSEFQNLLKEKIETTKADHGIQLSTHAAKRLQERNLEMDSTEFFKLRDAIDKLKSKGGQDSLVITEKAAYIVDVGNNKIVTAIDKNDMKENVFTKIDSTVVV